jgi:hypothetical protein
VSASLKKATLFLDSEVVLTYRTQPMSENIQTNASPLSRGSFLIKTVVNAAINSRIVNVVGDLLPGRVPENYVGMAGLTNVMEWPSSPNSRSRTARAPPPKLACPDG